MTEFWKNPFKKAAFTKNSEKHSKKQAETYNPLKLIIKHIITTYFRSQIYIT